MKSTQKKRKEKEGRKKSSLEVEQLSFKDEFITFIDF